MVLWKEWTIIYQIEFLKVAYPNPIHYHSKVFEQLDFSFSKKSLLLTKPAYIWSKVQQP